MGVGECIQGSGMKICRKENTWKIYKISFAVQIFRNSFFINTADKCNVLLHSV